MNSDLAERLVTGLGRDMVVVSSGEFGGRVVACVMVSYLDRSDSLGLVSATRFASQRLLLSCSRLFGCSP